MLIVTVFTFPSIALRRCVIANLASERHLAIMLAIRQQEVQTVVWV